MAEMKKGIPLFPVTQPVGNYAGAFMVAGGADGSYAVSANQIAWGDTTFNGYTFDGTTIGLLNAIEEGIAGGGQAYNYAGEAYDYANLAYTYSYSVVGKAVDAASTRASEAYTYTDNLANHVVNPHISDTAYHIQDGEREKWDYAYDTIKTFLDDEDIAETVDTLKEISYWLDNNEDAATLTVSLAELTSYTYNVVAKQADTANTKANVANNYAGEAYNWAKEAYAYAESAYAFAGTADANAATAYNWAKEAYNYANLAYTYSYDVVAKQADKANTKANVANNYAGEAYNWAKEAYAYAESAYAFAGTADANAATAYNWAKEAYTYTHNLATVNVIPHINNSDIHLKATDKQNWDDAFGKSHTHTNKGVLDGISADKVADWDDAAGKSHIHTNKGVLDNISSKEVTKWNEAAENITYFLSDTAELEGKIDTLKEIAYWLDNDLEDAAELTVSLAGLTSYTYNVVAKQADTGYNWAKEAWNYVNLAYTYSYSVVGAAADAAQTRADDAYSYTEAVGAVADNAISRISALESKDHDVQISYNVTSSETTTGYFISSVDVVRTENTNDYTLKYTYAYVPSPKADDYWAEYKIANTFSGYAGISQRINFEDVYYNDPNKEPTAYSINITNTDKTISDILFSISANNVEATTYFYFAVNGQRADHGINIGDAIRVSPDQYDGTSYSRLEGSITSTTFTGASLRIDLYDAGTTTILTSMKLQINVVADPT